MWLIHFSVFFFVVSFHFALSTKQRYDIRMNKVSDCSNAANNNTVRFNISVKNVNKTSFILLGEYNVEQNLDNEVNLHVTAEMKKRGEFREKLFVNDIGPLCDGMKMLSPKFLANFFGNGDVNKMCPILKGQYTVESQPMIIELPNVNTVPFGSYRVKFEGHQGESKVFCIAVFADVTKP